MYHIIFIRDHSCVLSVASGRAERVANSCVPLVASGGAERMVIRVKKENLCAFHRDIGLAQGLPLLFPPYQKHFGRFGRFERFLCEADEKT